MQRVATLGQKPLRLTEAQWLFAQLLAMARRPDVHRFRVYMRGT
ncbi:hypothetical protein HRbin36_02616 [bacterium HR36]|nr:hypothetical protein HRbin36_02616 [bacterium HR36]